MAEEKTYPCKEGLCDKECGFRKCPHNWNGSCIDYGNDIRYCMTEFGHDERAWEIVSMFLMCVLASGFGNLTDEELNQFCKLTFENLENKIELENKTKELVDKIKARKENDILKGEVSNGTESA